MIIDGHNDLVLRLWRGQEPRHIDLATAAGSGFAGGFFALFVPGDEALALDEAQRVAGELAATLEGLGLPLARRVEDFQPGRVTAIMHLEGAEAIAPDLSNLHAWYDRGVRSIGLVWSRPNAFAEGVPFAFPSSPDTGPGLTPAGRRLVRACNRRGILVDCSHLNEAGFWDVAGASDAPLVATHSNAHTLCPASRNLTDRQLDAIGESGGVVGVNFGTSFLRADGARNEPTPLSEIVRHVEYIARRIGVDHVAFGSDFEGVEIPDELGGVAGLPKLVEALRVVGFGEEDIARVTHRNWLRVLEQTWAPWRRYFDHAGDDPRETLRDAVRRFDSPGHAVDLGCGTGRDTAELLREGWSVVAIDGEQEAIDRLRVLVGDAGDHLVTQVASFDDATWPLCDLVNASFSLPFCPPDRFDALWQKIVASIRPGGRFCGQLFGDRDAWAGTGITVQTRAELEKLLRPFHIERLDEIDEDGSTLLGTPKHWHLYHVVARKRLP